VRREIWQKFARPIIFGPFTTPVRLTSDLFMLNNGSDNSNKENSSLKIEREKYLMFNEINITI